MLFQNIVRDSWSYWFCAYRTNYARNNLSEPQRHICAVSKVRTVGAVNFHSGAIARRSQLTAPAARLKRVDSTHAAISIVTLASHCWRRGAAGAPAQSSPARPAVWLCYRFPFTHSRQLSSCAIHGCANRCSHAPYVHVLERNVLFSELSDPSLVLAKKTSGVHVQRNMGKFGWQLKMATGTGNTYLWNYDRTDSIEIPTTNSGFSMMTSSIKV